MVAHASIKACELKNKRRALVTRAQMLRALVAALFLCVAMPAIAQQPEHAQPTPDHATPGVAAEQGEHAAEGEHEGMWAALLWPTVNFIILFGGLWYFLKEPLVTYLRDRHGAIRKDLVEAAEIKSAAAGAVGGDRSKAARAARRDRGPAETRGRRNLRRGSAYRGAGGRRT